MFKVVVSYYKHISFCLPRWCRCHRWFCCHPEIMCYHGNVRSYFSSLLNFLRKLIFLLLRNVVLIPTVISLLRAFKFLTFIIPRNASHILLVKYHFHKNNMAFFSINYFSCGTLVKKCQSDCFRWPRCMNWNKFPFDFNSFPKLPFTFYVICFGKFHLLADTFKILMRVRGILISPLQKSITNQSTVLMF